MFTFAGFFALYFFSTMLWFLWSDPLSLRDKIVLGSFALTALLSGGLLLTAKSVTPSDNQDRFKGLFWASLLVQVFLRILEVRR
jgi:hypothetical protein